MPADFTSTEKILKFQMKKSLGSLAKSTELMQRYRVGATKAFVLSLKYRDHKDNQFKVADYRIKRTDPENYRQNILLCSRKLTKYF